jgi:Asp/Glu/hydantoin racemase
MPLYLATCNPLQEMNTHEAPIERAGEIRPMQQMLAVIHTSPTLTPMFTELSTQFLPGVQVFHMVDESLIKDTTRHGYLRRVTMRRLLGIVESAAQSGADAVLITCSSIGAAVAIAQQIHDVPIIRVDEAMAERAVRMGRCIGVVATLRTTLDPTIALLRAKAAEAGREIRIIPSLCDGAFEAVMAGDTARHDAILTGALTTEMHGADVVVLAQASMARVVKSLPPGTLTVPVLSSPELAVQQVAAVLADLATKSTGAAA